MLILKQIMSLIKNLVTESTIRKLVAMRLSLKYRCLVHHTCHIDRPKAVFLAPRVNIGEGVHLRCPGNATIEIEEGTLINPYCILRADQGRIKIGEKSSLQYHTTIYGTGGVEIGAKTRISAHVLILSTIHRYGKTDIPIVQQGITGKGITIGSDVWIGAGAVILDGIKIGSHSIVGAGSVVTKDVPEYCLVGGNPARVIAKR